MENPTLVADTGWLIEVLEEVNLQSFHSKLVNDLQLTKLSHFDFVSEEDLERLGLSRPASRRLLAAVKKRKSFVNALKNKIVGKLMPSTSDTHSTTSTSRSRYDKSQVDNHKDGANFDGPKSEFGRLTCLINSQDILIKEEIGNGVHGFVKKGEWTTPNGRVVEVALKILKKDVMSEPGASFNDFVKEISVMHQLNHPNIIKLFGVVLSSPMMMVTELAPFGNLRDKLRDEGGHTPISQLINYGVQIASGMAYLESKRFVHRDLAARNIFITHGKKILIGDLGLMRAIPSQDNHYVMSERTKIPFPWCAPESLRYKQFSSSSDVYMFGVTLWEMFSFGKEPWANLTLNEILQKISTQDKRLPCPEACPTMVYQTLLQCWSTTPDSRPNFSTLYQYLSTSYPLEVRTTEHISEFSKTQVSVPLDEPYPVQSEPRERLKRKLLSCYMDDRILVIDGQPEMYWWKGQNLRTFDIGWFPLGSTRWLIPKKHVSNVNKPFKNSFMNASHFGQPGRWSNPKFIDRMYPRNIMGFSHNETNNAQRFSPSSNRHGADDQAVSKTNVFIKSRAKSRLSRLFGINDAANSQMLNQAYQKFIDEQPKILDAQAKSKDKTPQDQLIRSQSDELAVKQASHSSTNPNKNDEPPLIDFNEEIDWSSAFTDIANQSSANNPNTSQVQSLIDMDTPFPPIDHAPNLIDDLFSDIHRRASDTRIDQIEANYKLSLAGSWNTGTFYGSSNNIYSAYYCPQDADNVSHPVNSQTSEAKQPHRYYSTVADGNN